MTCDFCRNEADHLAWQIRPTGAVKRLCPQCEAFVDAMDVMCDSILARKDEP